MLVVLLVSTSSEPSALLALACALSAFVSLGALASSHLCVGACVSINWSASASRARFSTHPDILEVGRGVLVELIYIQEHEQRRKSEAMNPNGCMHAGQTRSASSQVHALCACVRVGGRTARVLGEMIVCVQACTHRWRLMRTNQMMNVKRHILG